MYIYIHTYTHTHTYIYTYTHTYLDPVLLIALRVYTHAPPNAQYDDLNGKHDQADKR